jgi:FSR family fosmidomycin resistance protein-like MFS transporter
MSTASLRQDAHVITVVGIAHAVSHFYHLILSALFVWLKPDFSLSYSELGFLMSMFFVVSGSGQALAGFLVDRVGALRVLYGGMALLCASALLLASAQSYAVLLCGSMLAGLGNSIFHPADFTLLNQRVSKARLAHAFSVHGVTGQLGWAAAPVFLAGVATLAGWRTALLAAAVIPFAVLVLLFVNRHVLYADPIPHKTEHHSQGGSLDFLRSRAVWMCFGFFLLTTVAMGGIQSFSPTTLIALYHLSLGSATTALTTFMLASACGMIIGGFMAARTLNHDRTIAGAFSAAALFAVLLSLAIVPAPMSIVLMGALGLCAGVAGPSRDLLIRAAAPKNATGRVFGVVYSGLDLGMTFGPLMFGAMLDAHRPSWVFLCVALFQALAIMTAVGVGGGNRAPALQKA